MKLHYFLTVLNGIDAERNSTRPKIQRGPKPARSDMSQIRTNWKDPFCLVNPGDERCSACDFKISMSDLNKDGVGLIEVVGAANAAKGDVVYENNMSCKWTIGVPDDKQIMLKWTRMDLEWHRFCAYDRVHVFDSKRKSRLGRWCGPRYHDPTNMPWDGERRFRRKCKPGSRTDCEDLDMYDTAYNTLTNQVVIAFDSDGTFTRDGFALEWTVFDRVNGGNQIQYPKQSLVYVKEAIDNALSRSNLAAGKDVAGLKRWNNSLFQWAMRNVFHDGYGSRGCMGRDPNAKITNVNIKRKLKLMADNVEAIDTHADWKSFNMHLFVDYYNVIIDWYVPQSQPRQCPRQPYINSKGKEKPHTVGKYLANKYADKFEVITDGSDGSHYDKKDRDAAIDNSTPISTVDLSDLLI